MATNTTRAKAQTPAIEAEEVTQHLYAGNIMSINPDKNTMMLMIKFIDGNKFTIPNAGKTAEEVPVVLFPQDADQQARIFGELALVPGDQVAFLATDLLEGTFQLRDGQLVHKAYGLDESSLSVAYRKKVSAKVTSTNEAAPPNLLKRFASIILNSAKPE